MKGPSRTAALIAAVAVQAALIVVAVAPRLSARVLGDTYLVRVEPLDPIEPFRGAYVTLRYTDFQPESFAEGLDDKEVFVPLVRDGDLWRGGGLLDERPSAGPFVKCRYDGTLRCGIESLFLPQGKAKALERELLDGGVARIKVDSFGHAAVLDVTAS
ncbi:MAG TPA: GDYXXLXY domain-containing protein [Mycobacteriales bacterium]|nr:GDYXXLXY domain-containing protein [Mycobacteriales bacterium]